MEKMLAAKRFEVCRLQCIKLVTRIMCCNSACRAHNFAGWLWLRRLLALQHDTAALQHDATRSVLRKYSHLRMQVLLFLLWPWHHASSINRDER
jgi:nitrate reductase gamma subunit